MTAPLHDVPFNLRVRAQAPLLFGFGVLLYAIAVIAHYAWIAIEDSREAALLAREAELRALKAQINPHFLFNTLNNLFSLAHSRSDKTANAIMKLSELMRTCWKILVERK